MIKLKAIAASIVVFMGFWIKYLLSQNARLEHKTKINDKINEIRENQKEAVKKVLDEERSKINEKVNDKPIDNSDDYLNGV